MNTSGVKHDATLALGRGLARYCKQLIGKSLVCATLFAVVGGDNTAVGQAPNNRNWDVFNTGDWARPGNWKQRKAPDPNSNVWLTNGTDKNKAETTLELKNNISIKSLMIGQFNMFSVSQDKKPRTFTVTTDMNNKGTLSLSLGGGGTFAVNNNLTNEGTIEGLGTLNVGKSLDNTKTISLSRNRLTVGKNLTNSGSIKGSGAINIANTLNNTGTILADRGGLGINTKTIKNTGTMAVGHGFLRINNSAVDNKNGTIDGGNKGFYVELNGGSVSGGSLMGLILGRGTILQDLRVIDDYRVWSQQNPQTPGRTTLKGTITLGDSKNKSGTIAVNSDAKLFIWRGGTTLTGKGTVSLTDETSIIQTFPLPPRARPLPDATLTLDKDITVEGSGLIGDGHLNLINKGSIVANEGEELVVDPGNGNRVQNEAKGLMIAGKAGTLILKGAISNQSDIEANGKDSKVTVNPGAGNQATNAATGSMQALGGGTLVLNGRIVNQGAIKAGPDSTVDITNANVNGNPATKDKKGTIEGKGNAKVSVNSSSLDNLAINMTSGSSLDASGSSISGGSITASTASINFDNTTVSNDALSILSSGILQMESSTISGGSLALSGSSTVLADGGTSNIALSIVDPGRLTVTPDAMLQILQDQETGGRTTIDGAMQALNGLTVTRGTLTGSGVIIGNLMLAGVLKPGDFGPGSITIQGSYSQSSPGLVDEELASPSEYNTTDITQSAALGGTLYIHLSDGFVPAVGQTFEIMDFASSTGTFDRVLGEYLGDGEKFDVIYNPTNVMLDVVPSGSTPEPGSLFLFGSGVIGLSAFLRKRLHKTA